MCCDGFEELVGCLGKRSEPRAEDGDDWTHLVLLALLMLFVVDVPVFYNLDAQSN